MKLLKKTSLLFFFSFISFSIFANEILEKLQKDTPKIIIPMHKHLENLGINASYTSDVYYLEFNDGLKAVFKTYDDEEENIKQNEAELMAYKIGSILGLNFVPRTCMRELSIDAISKKGCIKEYIENSLNFKNNKDFISCINEYSIKNPQNLEKINALKVFFFILGQYDCSHHNLFITQNNEDYNFHAIDNGEIHKKLYVQLGDAPFTQRGSIQGGNCSEGDFPFDAVEKFEASPEESLAEKIKNKFSDQKIPKYVMNNLQNFEKNNPGKAFPMVYYNNTIWMQTQGNDIDFFWKNINHCPMAIKEKLQYWHNNQEQLDILFEGMSFYQPLYKELLLDRINQIILMS